MKNSRELKWFTLIEIIVWILIFSIIIVSWFYALSSLMVWKVKLIEETDIEKKAFYFSEKFFEMIKRWWEVDYEEYFNRSVVWVSYQSWHYMEDSWFWNYWEDWNVWNSWALDYGNWFYYCRSSPWIFMWTWWCIEGNNNSDWTVSWITMSYLWEPQRYWQYSFQFKDYNINVDIDEWDEDWNWIITWDDDDEWLWNWPSVFLWWTLMRDLYLVNGRKNKRTYFRRSVKEESQWWTCDFSDAENPTWSGCLWTIEFLRLDWKDRGMDHDSVTEDWDGTQYDWIIDTWIIDSDFTWWNIIIAWSNNENYWQPIFPDEINVSDVMFFVYPNKDLSYSWMDDSPETNISPYVRIWLTLSPWWRAKRKIKWTTPKVTIKTTVSLTDVFSN